MVNRKESIGTTISDAIDEVMYKPMSLKQGSTDTHEYTICVKYTPNRYNKKNEPNIRER
jgi:hypothetical protein